MHCQPRHPLKPCASLSFLQVWLQLPIGAVQLAFDALAPSLERAITPTTFYTPRQAHPSAVGGGGLGGGLEAPTQQLNRGLRLLQYSGVVSGRTATALADVCADGWVLGGLVFLGTPGFLTRLGCVGVGLGWPAACSALLVGQAGPLALGRQLRWLKYWAVYSLLLHGGHELDRTGLSRVVFFPHHAHLLLLVWLQLPYFHGASTLHDAAIAHLARIIAGGGTNGSGTGASADLAHGGGSGGAHATPGARSALAAASRGGSSAVTRAGAGAAAEAAAPAKAGAEQSDSSTARAGSMKEE